MSIDLLRSAIDKADYIRNAKKHPEIIKSTVKDLKKALDHSIEWDHLVRPVSLKIENASYYYLMTGDKKALNWALDGVKAIEACKRYTLNHSTFIGITDIDLQTAAIVKALAIMRSAFGSILDKDIQKRICYIAVERCLKPAIEGMRVKKFWWTKAKHNWRSVMTGSLAMGAMAFSDVFTAWEEVVQHGIEGITTVMDQGDSEGGWNEGPGGYWEYGIVHCVEPAFFLRAFSKGKIDLFKHRFLKNTANFRVHMTIKPGRVWNWSDGHKTVEASVCAAILARVAKNGTWQHLVNKEGLDRIKMLYFYDPSLPAVKNISLPISKLFPDLGVAALRTGFAANDNFVGVKAGSVADDINHCHLDLGSIVIFSNGEELLSENIYWPYAQDQKPGSRKGGYFDFAPGGRRWNYDVNGGLGHNLPVIGSNYPRRDKNTKAEIKICKFSPKKDFMMIDMTQCYKPEALRVRRYVAYLRPGIVILVDELLTQNDVKPRILYHYEEEAELYNDSFKIKTGKAELTGYSLCPSNTHNVILAQELRKTSYHTEHQLEVRENKFVYIEQLHSSKRNIFVSALVFGKSGMKMPQIKLKGDPFETDKFSVNNISFDLKKGDIK
ncbi:MAG: heparinase II/III family protein [Fibrobacteres bacterium]|nr:heparinase II/III family protein [Fibrobacterota bacterium]